MSNEHPLTLAMAEVANAPKVKTKGGAEYTQVATRVEMFRRHFPALGISSDVVRADDHAVVMRATIKSPDGFVLATGHAEEVRSEKGVNSTSALENAETSAIGRALAAMGLAGGEFASADELAEALSQQNAAKKAEAVQEADRIAAQAVEQIEQAESYEAARAIGVPAFNRVKGTPAAEKIVAAMNAKKPPQEPQEATQEDQ